MAILSKFFKKSPDTEAASGDTAEIDVKRIEAEEKADVLEKMGRFRQFLHEEREKQNAEAFIEIGDYTIGHPHIWYWGDKYTLKIGKFCSLAAGVTILLGGEHHAEWLSTYMFNKALEGPDDIEGVTSKGDVIIGNDVWIGSEAKILSGVRIGDGCVIGANSLVTKDIPDYTISVGVPAKVIRKRFPDEVIGKLKEIAWWEWPDWDIYKAIPLLQNNDIEKLIEYHEGRTASKKNGT
ncbi:MAG: CatB-related O-acetyltransferase [Spirochaetaceae bacterium]|jgi:acetyltransferase-like isoleucine patch superfamily enzyme|nr:CatB-related O-acetyltransferase [Spirochaetaceae bacterium]